ncbi:MAG: MFS transporter [Sphingomonadales bacterium]
MDAGRMKLAMLLTYFVFAILLNSVGTVIMQSINSFGVTKSAAATLEGFKDISIAVVSFMIASFLPRWGYRRAMMIGLGIVTLACLAMPLLASFWATQLLFLAVGVSFALVKVSVYSSIGLITVDRKGHAAFMNTLEGFFMVGVLAGYWLFSMFIDSANPSSQQWLVVYWPLAGICALNLLLLATTQFDESGARRADPSTLAQDFFGMLRLIALPLAYVFVISAFLYVLIEQGLGTWLPTFNNQILKLPAAMSVQATSIFAATLAVGRLSAGFLMRYVNWYRLLNICLLAMAALVILTLPLTHDIADDPNMTWFSAPIAAYIFPLVGLFMAPIYPAINSVVLSALPKTQHSAMTGLIVIFSALGGTTGSIVTGRVFELFDGQTAFYFSLAPMAGLLISLFFFRRAVAARDRAAQVPA